MVHFEIGGAEPRKSMMPKQLMPEPGERLLMLRQLVERLVDRFTPPEITFRNFTSEYVHFCVG